MAICKGGRGALGGGLLHAGWETARNEGQRENALQLT